MNYSRNSYHIWLGIFDFDSRTFEQFWDNDEYEKALKLWKSNKGIKPAENLKCGFCQEMDLEELMEKDFWFDESRILYSIPDFMVHLLAKQRGLTDLQAFEKACSKKGIQKTNTVFALSVSEFLKVNPNKCTSMKYIGTFDFE